MGELSSVQARALQALHIIDQFCRKNEIDYFLLAGSALGAVRHKGFIPWDDDVDIGMTVPNYDRFCRLFHEDLPKGFFWSTPETNPTHPRFYGKLIYENHQCVDVFPVVKTSRNGLIRRVHWYAHKICLYSMQLKIGVPVKTEGAILPVFEHLLCRCYAAVSTRDRLLSQGARLLHLYEGRTNVCYINYCSRYSMEKEQIEPDWMGKGRMLMFEDGSFPVFENTDAYLRHLYGNYMELPPLSDRTPVHSDLDFVITKQME